MRALCRCLECDGKFEADVEEEPEVGLILADYELGCPEGCEGNFDIIHVEQEREQNHDAKEDWARRNMR